MHWMCVHVCLYEFHIPTKLIATSGGQLMHIFTIWCTVDKIEYQNGLLHHNNTNMMIRDREIERKSGKKHVSALNAFNTFLGCCFATKNRNHNSSPQQQQQQKMTLHFPKIDDDDADDDDGDGVD